MTTFVLPDPMEPIDDKDSFTQKEFNTGMMRLLKLLSTTMENAGYKYRENMDITKGHSHMLIAKQLHDLGEELGTLQKNSKTIQ